MELKLSCREFTDNDYEEVLRLVQSFEDLFYMFPKADFPLTKEQLSRNVENRPDSTVVLNGGEIVGFANFYEVEKEQYCSIGNVIVDSAFRGWNVGQYLIEAMERVAQQKYGVPEIHLSCFNTNTRGILLYDRLGYFPHKIEKRLDKNGLPIALIHMKKIL